MRQLLRKTVGKVIGGSGFLALAFLAGSCLLRAEQERSMTELLHSFETETDFSQ